MTRRREAEDARACRHEEAARAVAAELADLALRVNGGGFSPGGELHLDKVLSACVAVIEKHAGKLYQESARSCRRFYGRRR